jgi:NitT/TauT family transport system ATP-binding protein
VDLEELFLRSRKTVVFVTHDVEEAVLLSDRVLVLSNRPARIEADISIDLPRPRGFEPGEAAFREYVRKIIQVFEKMGVLRRQGAIAR